MTSFLYHFSLLIWIGISIGTLFVTQRGIFVTERTSLSTEQEKSGNPWIAQMVKDTTASQTRIKMGDLERERIYSFKPIGIIHSPYSPLYRPPRQGRLKPKVEATIEIDEAFGEGLEGIEDFDYIYVLFVFDRSRGWHMKVTPPGATHPRGVFASRSPNRPCPIGLTVVRLIKREGRILHIQGIDAYDGTPVLDIKPYISSIDSFPDGSTSVEKDLGIK